MIVIHRGNSRNRQTELPLLIPYNWAIIESAYLSEYLLPELAYKAVTIHLHFKRITTIKINLVGILYYINNLLFKPW